MTLKEKIFDYGVEKALDACKALGVELDEEFGFHGMMYRVIEDVCGNPELDIWMDGWIDDTDFMPIMIAGSNSVIHTHWKAKDYDDADAIDMLLFPDSSTDGVKVMKCKNGYEIHILDQNGNKLFVFYRGENMFPSIKSGETIELSDILNDSPGNRGW